MKRFIYKVLVYSVVVLLLLLPNELYNMYIVDNFEHLAGAEVRAAVKKSKTKINKKIKTIIFGDSTGHSLYPTENEYENIVSMTCNQAITMAGHYFLLKNYIENNADNIPEEVILLYTPFSLCNDVDEYAYQYFLKSFPVLEYKSIYTNHLSSRIKSIPLYWTANLPFIQTSNYTPRISVPKQQSIQAVSQITLEYLLLIDSLTKAYDISFSMYATPIRDDKKNEVIEIQDDFKTIAKEHLNHILLPYFESVVYYPHHLFFDRVHLYNDFIPLDYLNILKDGMDE